MAPSPMLATVLQSAFLGGLSNVLAQLLTTYKADAGFEVDWIPVIQFVLFALINTPPNFLWQELLETTFPAYPPSSPKTPSSPSKTPSHPPPQRLSLRNTATKLLLDQTLGASLNTLLFSLYAHAIRAAMAHAPRVTDLSAAVTYWTSPGAVNLTAVDAQAVWASATADFWGILTAGWKLWPAVALVNFTLVRTVQGRNLLGALAGVGWGMYMSMMVAK